VPIVIVIERLSIRAAIRRSWSLTIGYFWKTLGIQLLVAVIISAVSNIVSLPLSFILGLAGGLLNPQADEGVGIAVIVVAYILSIVVSVVVGAVSAVVQSATTALIYIDIRMRKEGLDLELARFVEARQAGVPVPDPYLLRQAAPTPA
jgi:membrane-anchored glycerophosphoryl diester phosphodiesterase (GDPDase)